MGYCTSHRLLCLPWTLPGHTSTLLHLVRALDSLHHWRLLQSTSFGVRHVVSGPSISQWLKYVCTNVWITIFSLYKVVSLLEQCSCDSVIVATVGV